MLNTKEVNYKKAYTELNEVIKKLSDKELAKIPSQVLDNIRDNIDKDYIWKYDDNKKVEEQNFLVETKALIVELYERYLCSEETKAFWNKYDKFCLNLIEKNKKKKYSLDNIFLTNSEEQVNDTEKKDKTGNQLLIPIKQESIFKKIINYIKHFF